MRIHELNLIRYGKFTDRCVELPFGAKDIHIIVGPNEAGKSTVRSAIGDWLFGIPMRTPFAFLHPMPELRIGGSIERVASADGSKSSLAFDRTKGNKNTLRTQQDTLLPDTVLQQWLGGLDAPAFNRMYALDHSTLVEGGAGILSASDDLGRMLFQSASGMEHLGQVLQRLQEEADALWAPRKSGSREYYVALEAFDKAHDELKKGTLRTRDWKAQHEALIECERALNLARQRHAETRAQISRLERIRRVQPLLLALDASQSRLDDLFAQGPAPLLPEDAAAILNKANQAMALADADIQRHQAVIVEAQAELEKIQVDHQLLSLASDINDLNERRLQYRAHRTDIVKRQEELRLELQRAGEKASGLGWTCTTIDEIGSHVPAQGIRSRLNRLLKGRGSLINHRQTAEDNFQKRQQEIAAFKETLKGLGADTVNPKLMSAVDQALKIGDYDEALLEFDARLQQLGDEIESALTELGTWRSSPEALASMSVPDLAAVQDVLNEQRADAAEEKSLRSALDAKKSECDRTRVELEQLVRTFQPISIEQVVEARASRDSRWNAIKAAPHELLVLAPDYERNVSQADGLSDSRLDKLQHEADRQSKVQRKESASVKVVVASPIF
ncbi:ATP-binding protein [Acidithiobacillus ferrivorans]|uniref:ATP-binding protein n=1 Tax=Acidithiobacillus ferrivorans TaxID=160808 RepID=UPI001C06DA42|nr:AAA family ATPase [Acidithiobacillus ferrivorans]MBU2850406.1 AAA family ATPase [Acidithiobacillus ferrivorans]